VGGNHRAEDQRAHVRQSDDRRMRVGSAARRSRVSFPPQTTNSLVCILFIGYCWFGEYLIKIWLLFFFTSFTSGHIGNNNQIKRVSLPSLFLAAHCISSGSVTHAGSGRLTASGGSFLTTRRRDFITTTPRRNVPCGTGQTTATSSLWPNYRYVPAKALSFLPSFLLGHHSTRHWTME